MEQELVQGEDRTWDAAGVAAIEESDQEEVVDANVELEADEEEVFDSSDDQETDELEAESEVEEDTEEVAPSAYDWDGNPNSLPPEIEYEGVKYDLGKVFKSMQGGYTKAMQDLRAAERQVQAQQAELAELVKAQRMAKEVQDDPRPQDPDDSMSVKEQNQRLDEIQAWIARQEYRKLQPQAEQKDDPVVDPAVVVENRTKLVKSQPGYSDEVWQKMDALVSQSEYWFKAAGTDDGVVELFNFAKTQMEAEQFKKQAAKKETESIRRKSKAATNTVSRSNSAPAKSAADNFRKWGFKEAGEAALREHGG